MAEFPEWFEILVLRFCVIYPAMMNEKADKQIWEFKKMEWFNALKDYRQEANEDAMNVSVKGRLKFPSLPEFCLICDEFHRTKNYDRKNEFHEIEHHLKTPQEIEEEKTKARKWLEICKSAIRKIPE